MNCLLIIKKSDEVGTTKAPFTNDDMEAVKGEVFAPNQQA